MRCSGSSGDETTVGLKHRIVTVEIHLSEPFLKEYVRNGTVTKPGKLISPLRALRARGLRMKWWHHFMVTGTLTLLYNVAWINMVGGALFGAGFVWWVIRRSYGYDLRAWWSR